MAGITERTRVITGEGPYRAPSALVADGALFAWSCRTGEAEHGELVSVCEISGTDPAEYAAHMRGHGRRSPAAPSLPGMWKAPARRDYAPKPMDPGQVIVWTVRIGAHWTVPPKYDAETSTFTEGIGWVDTVEYERIGTIWSQATSASTWWVTPEDDDPEPVIVRRQGKRGEYAEGQLYQSGECANWRGGIRRAENVRRHGVYAVADEVRQVRGIYGGAGREEITARWHTDPHCPDAAGKQRLGGGEHAYGLSGPDHATWTPASIADVMVGRTQLASPGPFCARCVMLEPQPEAARELVTA